MHAFVRIVSLFSIVNLAVVGCAEDPSRADDPEVLAQKMYPTYIDKLSLTGKAFIEDIDAQTDLRFAKTITVAEWEAMGWLPLPGGVTRDKAGTVQFNANAAAKWPPRAPSQDGPDDDRTRVAVLLVTSRIGTHRATYQSLLIRDPVKGDSIVDPFFGSVRVNSPRVLEVDLDNAPMPHAGTDEGNIQKESFACDGQEHTVRKLTTGTPLTATCASLCDDDYAKFTAVTEAVVTVTCPRENNCKPTNVRQEHGARIDLQKFHDKGMTDLDTDDSLYLTWDRANGQLECDYAWPCSRDFIGVSWEGKTAKASIYDDVGTPELVGAAATTAAHAAVTSHGSDVYFEPLTATAWTLLISQAAATLVATGTSFFTLGHSSQIQAHHKIPDAHATAVAICSGVMPVVAQPAPAVRE